MYNSSKTFRPGDATNSSYNEFAPSRWKRDNIKKNEDTRLAIFTATLLTIGVAILAIEYSGLADSLIVKLGEVIWSM